MKWLARFVLFLLLWLVLAGVDAAGLPFGLLAAGCATWASLALLPPTQAGRMAPVVLLRLAAGVVWQTLTAGIDIALRALNPAMPLRPGMLRHELATPAGPRQDAFRAMASLAPGALPTGTDAKGALMVHLLDTRLPAAAQLAETEALFRHG